MSKIVNWTSIYLSSLAAFAWLLDVLFVQLFFLAFQFLHDCASAGLGNVTAVHQLVQDEVRLVEVEDEVEFAHISKIFVEDLHKWLDQFKDDELVLIFVDNCDEVQTCITLVDYFVVFVVEEIAHFWLACQDHCVHLIKPTLTSRKNLCFSFWDMAELYHLVSRDRPCRLIKKKQWIIQNLYFL